MFSPVYEPARVIEAGTKIPQYVWSLEGVDVDVVLGTLISSSLCVVDESRFPNVPVAYAYVTDEVANTWFSAGIVEVKEFGQVTAVVYVVHIACPVSSSSSPTFPVAEIVVVAVIGSVL